jgi:hypothetical protein
VKTREGLILILVVLLAATRPVRGADDPAPERCHWQAIPELKAHLAVPDGWLFQRLEAGDALAYEVRPAGTQFEAIRARYRLEVRRGLDKTKVVEMARSFVESIRAFAVEAQPLEEQHVSTVTLYSCFVTLARPTPGAVQPTAALWSAANSRTGTLYTVRFDIPSDELGVVAPLANHLFRNLRLDDEV